MGYEQSQTTKIKEVNQSCIKLATSPMMHKRSKHIDTKFHFFREKIGNDEIKVIYSPTNHLAANLSTKALPKKKVEQHRGKLKASMQIVLLNNGKL